MTLVGRVRCLQRDFGPIQSQHSMDRGWRALRRVAERVSRDPSSSEPWGLTIEHMLAVLLVPICSSSTLELGYPDRSKMLRMSGGGHVYQASSIMGFEIGPWRPRLASVMPEGGIGVVGPLWRLSVDLRTSQLSVIVVS